MHFWENHVQNHPFAVILTQTGLRNAKEELEEIDRVVEDAVASIAIEGYITSKKDKEQLKEWLIMGLSADEIVKRFKKNI